MVVDYAQRALETQCQLMVSVRSANSGGLIVRGHYFKGDDPALSLAKQSWCSVTAILLMIRIGVVACCELSVCVAARIASDIGKSNCSLKS